jgi:hypothetical protein
MENKVYGIFSGAYSDWSVHGFFESEDEAMVYCAIKNQGLDEYDKYYIMPLSKINAKIPDIKLNYFHTVVFDFNNGMRSEEDRYDYYIGEDKPSFTKYNVFKNNDGWISFSFNGKSREKAEKIAQDKYTEFLQYYSELESYDEAAKLIGAKHV